MWVKPGIAGSKGQPDGSPSSPSRARRSPRYRPAMASLEERLLLSTLSAVGSGVGDGTSHLYEINDYATAPTAVDIGSTGTLIDGFAFDPRNDAAYGVNAGGKELYSIDLQTGEAGAIGSTGSPGMNALAISSGGTMYAMSGGSTDLYTLNPATGQATAVFNTGYASSGDLAFASGNLYLTSSADLVKINLANDTATAVGPLGVANMFGMGIDSSGAMYGAEGAIDASTAILFGINKTTGAATEIGTIADASSLGVYGLAFENSPNPTLTALRASTTSAATGQSVTFTATVSDLTRAGPTPNGGTVTFSDQGGTIGSATLVNGVAEFTTTGLPAGTDTITASYGGTASFAPSATGTIVTAAGDGTAGYEGDDGPATSAELNGPWGMAFDTAGDLFFADSGNNVVREVVKATGDIVTVAGNGKAGYSGDNGPATDAELNGPNSVAVDSAGDLFISDANNNRIREVVKATGHIITVAGDGTAGYTGNGGPATDAEINSPRGLAVDSAGDVFFADCLNNVIRAVVKFNGQIITVAGDGTAGYSGDGGPATDAELNQPSFVVVDSAGDLFFSDSANHRVREVVKSTGDIITYAGNGKAGYSGDNGPATDAELNGPSGLALDPAGDLFIADTADNVVREVVAATGDIITVAGTGTAGYSGDNGPATAAEMNDPGRVAVDTAGDLFIADAKNNRVREVGPAVTVTVSPLTALPTLTALVASTASAPSGQSITFTATVSDLSAGGPIPNGGTVTFSDQNGTIGSATLVNGAATFTTSSLAMGTYTVTASYGGTADFAASATGTITTAVGDGTAGYAGDGGPAIAALLNYPAGMAFDSAGDLFIADVSNNVIREVVKATDEIITIAGNGTAGYSGDGGPAIDAELNIPRILAFDSQGDLFVTDQFNNVVREITPGTDGLLSDGTITTVAGDGKAGYSGDGGPATDAELDGPTGLAFDPAGDLFIADQVNNRIREVVKATGDIVTYAGTGTAGYTGDGGPATDAEINSPRGISTDASGDLFIAEWGNHVIREVVKLTGDIITVAGDGKAGFSGDGGPATDARLEGPLDVAVDSLGDVFITDSYTYRVREVVKATGDIITVAGDGTFGYSGDGGPATDAETAPGGVAVDPAGDVFITDVYNNVVREFTTAVTVTVTQAVANQVAIISDPLTLIAGVHGGPITVQLEDADGDPITSTVAQTIQLSTTSSAGAFYDSAGNAITSVTIPAGQSTATFDYADIKAGTPTITATDSALNSSSNQQETVDPAAASQLVIHTQPSSTATAGQAFATQPVIYEEDQYGNLETGDNSTVVTASLASGSGTLIGTKQVTVQRGIASFDNLEDDTAGTLTLKFSAGTLPPVVSDPSTVSPAVPTSLGVVVNRPPGGIPVGSKFTVVATAYDAYNNVAASFNSPVTLGLASGSAGTLTGNLTQTASAGVAKFTDLSDTTSGSISRSTPPVAR